MLAETGGASDNLLCLQADVTDPDFILISSRSARLERTGQVAYAVAGALRGAWLPVYGSV